jgi:hypothetical protein
VIDRDRLAADLAREHGVRVDPDDPVLTAALLNQRLLDEAIARLETVVMTSADRISTAATRQAEDARNVAASLVTRAGEWSAERLRAAAEEAGIALLAQIQREVLRAERAGRTAVRIAWVMGCLGAIALAGLAGFLSAASGHG